MYMLFLMVMCCTKHELFHFDLWPSDAPVTPPGRGSQWWVSRLSDRFSIKISAAEIFIQSSLVITWSSLTLYHINGLVQDCSISIANALEILQSCTKASTCIWKIPDKNVDAANMGPIWVLSAPGEPHVGPMNLAIRDVINRSDFQLLHLHINKIMGCILWVLRRKWAMLLRDLIILVA